MAEEPTFEETIAAGSPELASRPRRNRKKRRTALSSQAGTPRKQASINYQGGRYGPLEQPALDQIDQAAMEILETIGVAHAPPNVEELVLDAGGRRLPNNRLAFPSALVTSAIAGLRRDITLYGQISGQELDLSSQQVHAGTGGAAPFIVDINNNEYRNSTLMDLYDAARLVDTLRNIQFFSRSMVATDISDKLSLDINTAYASLVGTTKHVMVSASSPASVDAIADICFAIAGSKENFVARPFLSLNINHVVSPLKFDADACEVLSAAAQAGIPVSVNTFSQLGASNPVTIAGCVAQTVAETLAGMVIAWLTNPHVAAVFGPRPMVTDLRTGGMAGGAGEQALLTACAVQMANYYKLASSTIAGATDSKISDAQSGYEKSLSITLAAQSGCNLITQACGMHAGLMACSLESYVIDNDMLGGILRSLAPVEVNGDTVDIASIRNVVEGDGHFLGQQQTLQRMQTDFLYPSIADRRDHEVWSENGAKDIRTVANANAREILQHHFPSHVAADVDSALRQQFDIRLPEQPSCSATGSSQ